MSNGNDFFLDIDNLGEVAPESNDAAPTSDIQDLVLAKNNKPETQNPLNIGGGQKLEEVYDRLMKLIFLFDTSGSMGDTIIDDTDFSQWAWDMKAIRAKLVACDAEVANAQAQIGPDADVADAVDELTLRCAGLKTATDDEIKGFILREDLTQYFGVLSLSSQPRKSKMAVVRDLASSEIRKRIAKYNESDIRVITFDQNPHTKGARTQSELVAAVSSMMPAGGTDICAAVEAAMRLCKKAPSPVNLHHLVLISDGLDYGAVRVKSLIPEMKRLGVVFDYIYIKGTSENDEDITSVLKQVCEETGGEFVEVQKVKDLAQKFIAAAERKMLPPPANV
jgi:hypothetical protein